MIYHKCTSTVFRTVYLYPSIVKHANSQPLVHDGHLQQHAVRESLFVEKEKVEGMGEVSIFRTISII